MNIRLLIAYAFIAIGASDLLLWLINGLSFGWMEFVIGVNAFSTVLPWTLITIGIWLIRKDRVLKKLEIELITEIDTDETIQYRQDNGGSIFILTNKKILFRNYAMSKEMVDKYENMLIDERRNIEFSEIESFKHITSGEIAVLPKDKKSTKKFGIQLILTNGEVLNFDLGMKSEIAFAHLQKNLKSN